MTHTRLRTIAAGFAIAATLTGCGALTSNPYEKTGPEDTAEATQHLTELPALEATEDHAQRVAEELGAFITSLAPNLQWEWVDSRSRSGCNRPYDQTEGKKVTLPNYLAEGSVPERAWQAVLQRARELAAELGATEVQTFHNEPGNRDVRFYSRESTSLTLGDRGNTVISIDTGCRLPESIAGTTPPAPTP